MINPDIFGHGRTAGQRCNNKEFQTTWAKRMNVVKYPDLVSEAFYKVWEELNG